MGLYPRVWSDHCTTIFKASSWVKFLNRRYFGDPKTSKSKQEIVDDINNLAEIVGTKKQFHGSVEPKDLVILLETFDSFQGEIQQQLSSELICSFCHVRIRSSGITW